MIKELSPKVIKKYARDLKSLLGKGTIIEQRSFIKSFLKKIVVNRENIEIEYTIPIQKEKVEPVNREVLPIASIGSPEEAIGRTFKVAFEFNGTMRKLKPVKSKPEKSYSNPIYLAMEWQAMLDNGECESRAELARKLGVSRARVTQVLNLLKINPKVLAKIKRLGDPWDRLVMTERKPREIDELPLKRQKKGVNIIIGLAEAKRQ